MRPLGRDVDEFNRTAALLPIRGKSIEIRVADVFFLLGPLAGGADKRPFHVDAEDLGPGHLAADRRPGRAHGAADLLVADRHRRRAKRRHAARSEVCGHLFNGFGAAVARVHIDAAVDVDIDKAGGQDLPGAVEDLIPR